MRYFGGGVGHRTTSFRHIKMVLASDLQSSFSSEEIFQREPGDIQPALEDVATGEEVSWVFDPNLDGLYEEASGDVFTSLAMPCKPLISYSLISEGS